MQKELKENEELATHILMIVLMFFFGVISLFIIALFIWYRH